MKLSDMGLAPTKKPIVFVGEAQPTGKMSSEGEEYFAWKLKEPVIVRCSVDPAIEPIEVDELFVRESHLNDDENWEFVNGKDNKDGITHKDWVADFSKSQEVALFQPESIVKWMRNNRKGRTEERRLTLNERIRERMKERGK